MNLVSIFGTLFGFITLYQGATSNIDYLVWLDMQKSTWNALIGVTMLTGVFAFNLYVYQARIQRAKALAASANAEIPESALKAKSV